MQNSEKNINERIPFKAENTPLIHQMACRAGVLCTRTDVTAKGQIVVTGGSTSGASVAENPANNLAQLFQVQAFGLGQPGYPQGTLKKVIPRTLIRRRAFDEGRIVPDQQIGIGGLTGAAGTFLINSPFRMFWALPWLLRPLDSALDTGMFGSIQLTITNGSRAAQNPTTDRTYDYSGLFWDIYHSFQKYNGNGQGPTVVMFDDDRQRNLSGSNTRLEINKEFPPDGFYIDLLTMAQTTNNALADTIVNRVTLNSGTEQFMDMYSDEIKSEQEGFIDEGSTTITSRTGLYYQRIAEDGLLTNAKPAVSAVIDQANPGTDNLILARRVFVPIPTDFQQKGGQQIKTGHKVIKRG